MSKVISTTIDEAIARIDDWKGKKISYTPVSGGITNPNFKVNVDGKNFFLKIPGAGTDFIDRGCCHAANMIASDSGTGAKVYYYFEDTGVEVFEWLEGYRSCTVADCMIEEICMAGVKAIKKFHDLPNATLPLEQSLFDQCRDMVARCKSSDYIPPWNDKMLWLMDRIEHAFNTCGVEKKPCHNDYWYNNLMWNDETKDAKIIDLEYASMNDPLYDVALWMLMIGSTDDMDRQAVIAYNDGVYDEKLFARMKLNKIAADIKWSYWSLQQTLNSNVDNDYYNWYSNKAARLQYYFVDPRVDMWLNLLEGKPVWRTPDAWNK